MKTQEALVTALAALLLAALLASPVACTMNRQRLVAEAIKNGADPLAAKCAIEGSEGDSRTSAMCMAKALERR